jgi:alkylation response protein AidB-like acyl-CoA dehydrogenase
VSENPEHAAFRAEARAFLAEHFPRWKRDLGIADGKVLDLERQRSWQHYLYEHGWGAPTWPPEFGGRGLGMVESMIWNEERATAGAHSFFNLVGLGLAGPTIIARGTPEQKERYLPPLARGDEVWCQLFSEPGAGSDLGNISTRADRVDDEWIVNGQKVWSSGAMDADRGMLVARYDFDLPKQQGLVYLLIDMHSPGVDVRPLRQIDGGAHFCEVYFDDVRVPDKDRMGEPGDGWSVAITTLTNERMSLGGGFGNFSLPFEEVVRIASEHGQAKDPLVRQRLVDVFARRKILDVLNMRVQAALVAGRIPEAEGSVIKLLMAQLGTASATSALELMGAEGMLAGSDGSGASLEERATPQQRFLGSAAMHIGGGTDEIQRNAIAERVLGLPREPRPDKEVPFKETRR